MPGENSLSWHFPSPWCIYQPWSLAIQLAGSELKCVKNPRSKISFMNVIPIWLTHHFSTSIFSSLLYTLYKPSLFPSFFTGRGRHVKDSGQCLLRNCWENFLFPFKIAKYYGHIPFLLILALNTDTMP